MRLYIAVSVVILLIVLPSTAWQYCSEKVENASCIPCTERGKQFKCPKQCNITRDIKLCTQVCNDHCINSECEYDEQGGLICLHGCNNLYFGLYCQEYCMDGCDICTRDGNQCLQCEQGLYGEICDQTCNNCNESECDINGTCLSGCTDGYYGPKCNRKCHTRCIYCDIATGECRQCINGWFGNNCTQKCQNCNNKLCTAESGQCKDECKQAVILQGKTCQIEERDDNSTEKPPVASYGSFHAKDYIWVFVVCSVVICVGSIIVLAVKCTRMKTNHRDEKTIDAKALPIESLYTTVQKRCNVPVPSSSDINKMVDTSNVNGLIYVDLDLPPPSMIDGEAFVSRKEEPTHYVDIDFTLTPGPQLPDKIIEEGSNG